MREIEIEIDRDERSVYVSCRGQYADTNRGEWVGANIDWLDWSNDDHIDHLREAIRIAWSPAEIGCQGRICFQEEDNAQWRKGLLRARDLLGWRCQLLDEADCAARGGETDGASEIYWLLTRMVGHDSMAVVQLEDDDSIGRGTGRF